MLHTQDTKVFLLAYGILIPFSITSPDYCCNTMDDTPVPKSNYALQLALQTMKERCVQLQKRVSTLQEENIALRTNSPRIQGHALQNTNSLEIKLSRLTEERNQLKNTITMVAAENRQLWSSLSRLTHDSKHFAMKNVNIEEKLNQQERAHMPLIRSRTFTQESPHTKHLQKVLSENDKVSLELEDISLKLQVDINNDTSDHNTVMETSSLEDSLHSLGFNYLEDVDDSMSDCMEQHLVDLQKIKSLLTQSHDAFRMSIDDLLAYKLKVERSQQEAEKQKREKDMVKENEVPVTIGVQTDMEQQWGTPESSLKLDKNMDKVCPMCCKRFHLDVDFDVFTRHVEEHFVETDVLRL